MIDVVLRKNAGVFRKNAGVLRKNAGDDSY